VSDESLEAEVARVMAAEDTALDPRLEAYARGTLDEASRRELEARAALDPALAAALVLFAPLDERLLAATAARVEVAVPDRPAPTPRVWRRRAVAAAAAIAAGWLVLVLSGRGSEAPLPGYTLRARTGEAILRSSTVAGARVRADSVIEVVLVPEVVVDGPVLGALFVRREGAWRRSDVPPERSEDGAFRWRGTAQALTGSVEGAVALWPSVARREAELGPEGHAPVSDGLPLLIEIYPKVP
jgi:hypothetical protein